MTLDEAPAVIQADPYCPRDASRELLEEWARLYQALVHRREHPPYRVGRSLGRTLYRHDTLIGLMDTAEDAALVVQALNYATAVSDGNRFLAGGAAVREHGSREDGRDGVVVAADPIAATTTPPESPSPRDAPPETPDIRFSGYIVR